MRGAPFRAHTAKAGPPPAMFLRPSMAKCSSSAMIIIGRTTSVQMSPQDGDRLPVISFIEKLKVSTC